MSDWLTDPELCRFALRVIGEAGQMGERKLAISALVSGRDIVPAPVQDELGRFAVSVIPLHTI